MKNETTQMTKTAIDLRGEFIQSLLESGMSAREVEDFMDENLNTVNIICQVWANYEEKTKRQ